MGAHLSQQVHGTEHPLVVTAGYAGGAPLLQTDGHQHRVVPVPQLLQGEIPAHPGVAADLHAQGGDHLDLPVQHILRQAVVGDAVAHHAAGLLQGLEHHHLVAQLHQVVGGGEPRRAGADDGRLPARGLFRLALGGDLPDALVGHPIHGIALEPADGDGLSAPPDGTGGFATMGADPPADMGEGVGAVHLPHRLLQVVLPDGADVLGGVHVGGTGVVAHAALDAARGLDDGRLAVVALDDLPEIVDPFLRRQFRHGLAFQVQQVGIGGLGPAQSVILAMHADLARQHEIAVDLLLGAGVNILARKVDGTGGADVHAQSAPAAAAVVDGRPQIPHPRLGVVGQTGNAHHGDGCVVAHLLTAGATDALVPGVEVETPVARRGDAGIQRLGDRLASQELEVLQRRQHRAHGVPVDPLAHRSTSGGQASRENMIWAMSSIREPTASSSSTCTAWVWEGPRICTR